MDTQQEQKLTYPPKWTEQLENKLTEFFKNEDDFKQGKGIFRQDHAIPLIKKVVTTPRNDISIADTQTALLKGLYAFGTNNRDTFSFFKDSVEPYAKILLIYCSLLSAADFRFDKAITSIGQANKLLKNTLEERFFMSNTDRVLWEKYLDNGAKWRNDWHHKTPPDTDFQTHNNGSKAWLCYLFAVAAACFQIKQAHGGIRFLADCDCDLRLIQPGVNSGSPFTPKVLKGYHFQINRPPGDFQLEITLTDSKGRNHTEVRTGTIERDKYITITIKASTLGRDDAPRFIPNPLLMDMLQKPKKEMIPFKGGSYEGSLNTQKLPHGMGTFTLNGITYEGRFNDGEAEGSFFVKGKGFKYQGTLCFEHSPWGFGKGELSIEQNGQKLIFKEASFKGKHCVTGSLYLNGKLFYKGSFAIPSSGLMPVTQGFGELHSEDGSVYYGEVDNLAPHGCGCLVEASGRAFYTDWFQGNSTEAIHNLGEIAIGGDRPAWLFDGERLVCPLSGKPLSLQYIGVPAFSIRDGQGNRLSAPDLAEAKEWKYRFNTPAEKTKKGLKAKPEETTPKARAMEAMEKGPMETSGNSIKKAAKSIPEEFAPKIVLKANKTQAEKKLITKKGDNGKYGFVDEKGNWCIYPLFEEIGDFKEGMAKIRLDGLYGFINNQGKTIIPPIYHKAWSFLNGLAIVEKNGLYGHINKLGKVVIPIQYKDTYPFQDKPEGLLAEVERADGSWIFIDKDNKFVKFSDRGAAKEESLPKTTSGSKVTRKPGQDIATGCKRNERNNYYPVDKYGDQVGTIESWDYITFHEDLAAIRFWFQDPNNIMLGHYLYGFINRNGEWAIRPIFWGVHNFNKGCCPVAINKGERNPDARWGIIDKEGNWILEPKYNYIGHYDNALGGFRAERIDGTYVTLSLSEE